VGDRSPGSRLEGRLALTASWVHVPASFGSREITGPCVRIDAIACGPSGIGVVDDCRRRLPLNPPAVVTRSSRGPALLRPGGTAELGLPRRCYVPPLKNGAVPTDAVDRGKRSCVPVPQRSLLNAWSVGPSIVTIARSSWWRSFSDDGRRGAQLVTGAPRPK